MEEEKALLKEAEIGGVEEDLEGEGLMEKYWERKDLEEEDLEKPTMEDKNLLGREPANDSEEEGPVAEEQDTTAKKKDEEALHLGELVLDQVLALQAAVLAEAERTSKSMWALRNVSNLLGWIFAVAATATCFAHRGNVRIELIVPSYLVSAMAFVVASKIEDIYGTKKVTDDSVRGVEEPAGAATPKAYLLMSAAVLLVSASCRIVANFVLAEMHGWHHRLECQLHGYLSLIYVASALLGITVAFVGKQNRLVTCYIMLNGAGVGLSIQQIVDVWGAHRQPVYLLVMKFFPDLIIPIFCLTNLLHAVGLVCDFPDGEQDEEEKAIWQGRTTRSVPLGILGALTIGIGIALQVLLTTAFYLASFDSHSLANLLDARIVTASLLLPTGVQAFLAFNSAKTIRCVTLAFMTFGLLAGCVYSTCWLVDVNSAMVTRETYVIGSCEGTNSREQFCVYNTTEESLKKRVHLEFSHFSQGGGPFYRPKPKELEEPLPKSCIPRDKYCDGTVDLSMDPVGASSG